MIQSNKLVVLGSGRVRAAGLVRCVSGLAAGWRSGDSGGRAGARRGATLILIVGALALLSVVVLSYFLIGKADRRTGATAVRKDNIEANVNLIGAYISQDIIGNDVFSIYIEGANADLVNPDQRYAYVVREAWDGPWTDPQRRSQPEKQNAGWIPGTWQHDRARFDARGTVPSSFDPITLIGSNKNRIEPFPGSDPWLASTLAMCLNPVDDEPRFLPPPPNNFDSILENSRDWLQLSNIGPDGRYVNLYNLRGRPDAESGFSNNNGVGNRISDNLTLMNALGQSIYPLGSQQTDYGTIADPNTPTDWSNRQQRAFRPVGPADLDFADPAFPDYQWADTDGDGWYDARWCELVDATTPDNPLLVLPKDGRYRYFVAARIVDLSGLVNVNVATDQGLNPANPGDPLYGVNNEYRVGLTPSDIDLRNLLTLANQKQLYSLADLSDGYSQLKQPVVVDSPGDYRKYANDPPLNIVAHRVGAYGYNGIAATIGGILAPMNDVDLTALPPLQAADRYDYYRFAGGFLTGEAGFDGVDRGITAGLFGTPDLIELLTYRGVNDPANRSRLERAVGGRELNNPVKFSPLRDNRSLEVEKSWDTTGAYGQADLEALMWSALDVRQLLTTVSGARPLRSVRLAYSPSNLGDIGRVGRALSGSRLDPLDPNSPTVNEEPVNAQAALNTAAIIGDPYFLFRGYCDALLPLSGDLHAWDPVGAFTTMAYGYNPEAALRIAGAVTTNQIDLYDTDNIPHAYTLLLDGSVTGRTAVTNAVNFPWWSEGPGGQLDLDQGQLAQEGATRLTENLSSNVTAPAINVFGIEAQPFITEVASFIMYTDTPNPPGDNETLNPEVTINGTVSQSNGDFLFQCIAFQLNNPFNTTIQLGSVYTNDVTDVYDYHFEFGGRQYPIVELKTDNSQSAISIFPGETKVFYFLSQSRAQILARMKVAEVNPGEIDDVDDLGGTTLSRWIDEQLKTKFGATTAGVQIPANAGFIPSVQQLLAGAPGDLSGVNREARLWRVMRSAVDAGMLNSSANDLLVDRIRDPEGAARPTLDRRLPTGQGDVGNTDVNSGDDSGYTITLWGSIRRPNDPHDAEQGNIVPRGALPAWCIERKFGTNGQTSLNHEDTDEITLNNLQKSDFTIQDEYHPGGTTILGMLDDQDGPGGGPVSYDLVDTLQATAEAKNSHGDLNTVIPTAQQIDGLEYDDLYPEVHLENNRFIKGNHSVLRTGDMLLALGVSAWHDPAAQANDPNDLGQQLGDDRWTTLGESLAVALGYNEPPALPQYAPISQMYSHPTDPTLHPLGKTDRGSLRLDAFVPFVDQDGSGDFDPAMGDESRSLGIPLALNIFDVFSTVDPQFGSLSRATVGVVNINTAPEMVLRTLPMLSPPADIDLLGNPTWWWPGGAVDNANDFATTFIAYRDKTRLVPRGVGATDLSFVGPANIPAYYNPDPNAALPEYFGRGNLVVASGATQIPNIREQPGFGSKGEVMAVRDRQYAGGAPGLHDIDRVGLDRPDSPGQGSTDKRGVDSINYKELLIPNSALDDQIQDDYDEKLVIANGLMNSISVRSDVYAATFVIHGYQKSDCMGLTDRDPLVPSVARRYLMVVDRSNVVKTGDKPRILVFKEMPLK